MTRRVARDTSTPADIGVPVSVPAAMMESVATPTSRALVGRDEELDRLVGLLDHPDPGAAAVLLAGDAGVGKTRLLMELRDRALERGWTVLAGHCLDFGESALPYLPFSEVIGRVAAVDPGLLEQVAADHPEITRLQPGRRARTAAGHSPASDIGSTTDRSALFEAVQGLLLQASERAPVLLVIEDVHWADNSTRDMLGYLFSRDFGGRVQLVVSYRSDDLHRRHPLRRQAAQWTRLPGLDRLALTPLSDHAVRDLVGELATRRLADAEVASIVARAEGNAFFVEELVASQCWDEVPDDLADLLLVRLDPLDERARQVVRTISVSGRRISHDLLAAVTELPAEAFEAGVRQAVELNLLEAGPRHYTFRHALLAEAVYDDLLPGERVRLHARYVDVLAEGRAPGTAAELARHARRANDLDRAVAADIEAGDEAMAVGGPGEAADHYQRALGLLAEPTRVERVGVDVAKVATKAADALAMSGDTQRAAELLAEHLDGLSADGDATERHARARLLSGYASWLTIIESEDDPVAVSREAVALAPTEEVPLRAKILATHARVLAKDDDLIEEAETAATEALALAERLTMPVLASEVVTTLGLLSRTGEVRPALEKAVARAEEVGATHAAQHGRFMIARSYQDEARWADAMEWFRSVIEAGERSGLRWAPFAMEARWQLSRIAWSQGDWDAAVAIATPDAGAPAIPAAVIAPVRLGIEAARGQDVDGALRRLRTLWPDEGVIAVYSAEVEIAVATARADATAAVAAYDDAADLLGRLWTEHFSGRVRLAALALGGIARAMTAVSAQQRAGWAAEADRLLAEGEAVAQAFRAGGREWGIEGRAWSTRLVAEHRRAAWLADVGAPSREELRDGWAETVAAFDTFGHVPETARLRASYARVLRATGDPTAASEQVVLARAVAERLDDRVLLADLDAQEPAPGARSPETTASTPRLTAREQEILALVAEGRSNGEIGRMLFISTKTVSVHVSNILGKLGAAGRTEAAAIARRDGLLA
ncbi:AAA family ATPase [Nocardioides sp. BGMRC 2183]|nr:AAA family ATPase [Nocardioides sp. BGMRC 2183]